MLIFYYSNYETIADHAHSLSFSAANIDFTLAAYPYSKPICQHAPLNLNQIDI